MCVVRLQRPKVSVSTVVMLQCIFMKCLQYIRVSTLHKKLSVLINLCHPPIPRWFLLDKIKLAAEEVSIRNETERGG